VGSVPTPPPKRKIRIIKDEILGRRCRNRYREKSGGERKEVAEKRNKIRD
jgi:hypothetical protein